MKRAHIIRYISNMSSLSVAQREPLSWPADPKSAWRRTGIVAGMLLAFVIPASRLALGKLSGAGRMLLVCIHIHAHTYISSYLCVYIYTHVGVYIDIEQIDRSG